MPGRKPSLTPEQIAHARACYSRRYEIRRKLKGLPLSDKAARAPLLEELRSIPTREEIAELYGVHLQTVFDHDHVAA